MSATTKPLLLLDVDGVLAPFSLGSAQLTDLGPVGVLALHVRANMSRLAQLDAAFEIVWCTAREADAATIIGPLHGLRELPFISFGTVRVPGRSIIVPANPSGGSWKLPAVAAWCAEHAAGHPLAWLDDDLGDDILDWARARSAAGAATHCEIVDPHDGVSDTHVQRLLNFAA